MLDMLGSLIGFVTVVFLLSLVSTSLVQMTSSMLRLRGRNLFRSLERVVQTAGDTCGLGEVNMNPKELAERVCSSPALLELGRSVIPGAVPRWLRGPSRTWIDKGELKEILDGLGDVPKELVAKVEELFPRLEALSAKRFAFFMRTISIFWALVIAVVFQVSTPDLLQKLSTDAAFRESAIKSIEDEVEYESVPAAALDALAERHAELGDVLKAVKEAGAGKTDLISDLRAALKDREDAETVMGDYAELHDKLLRERIESSVGSLAQLDIEPWGQGDDFYGTWVGTWPQPDWRNILGVLLTAALLSLGAPFWFQMLKNLSGLRDLLAPGDKKSGGGTSTKPPDAGVA